MNLTLNGVEYDDGPQEGLCAREKLVRTFEGSVSLTDTGRVVSRGVCSVCLGDRYMEIALYTP